MERLAEVLRADEVESVHLGHVAVVGRRGRLLYAAGEPETRTFYRSAAKPLQTMVVVAHGAADHFGFGLEELALMSASHNGEPVHTQGVARMLTRLGLTEDHLRLGAQPPLDEETARQLDRPPGRLHAVCSGKHAGMLAFARYLGSDLDGYWRHDHPVQEAIRHGVARLSGLTVQELGVGVDGCGVPTFAVPVRAMAVAYQRFGDPSDLPGREAEAARRVAEALRRHPYLVAGRARFDTDCMQATGGRILVKGGSEGVGCISIPSEGLGIAVKVADGHPRALAPVLLAVLTHLGLLRREEETELAHYRRPPVYNSRGEVVGRIEPRLFLKEVTR